MGRSNQATVCAGGESSYLETELQKGRDRKLKKNVFFSLSVVFTVFLTIGNFSKELYAQQEEKSQKPNVILLTLDGVRWQEFFYGEDQEVSGGSGDIFTIFWKNFSKGSFVLGDKSKRIEMKATNTTILSLPAYQSIMAGFNQGCWTNLCGRIEVETFMERVRRVLQIPPIQVATIASWEPIEDAVAKYSGRTFVNTGQNPLNDPVVDEQLRWLNDWQQKDTPPWSHARYDKYTFAHAMRFLKLHKPRLLFISLNDSDEWGHKENYTRYLLALKQYDFWIRELISTLEEMGDYGKNTTLIVTTDHGRGDGDDWGSHGFFVPESRNIWLIARNKYTQQNPYRIGRSGYTHLDIRPTIEAIFGLKPQRCEECGRVIREIHPY